MYTSMWGGASKLNLCLSQGAQHLGTNGDFNAQPLCESCAVLAKPHMPDISFENSQPHPFYNSWSSTIDTDDGDSSKATSRG